MVFFLSKSREILLWRFLRSNSIIFCLKYFSLPMNFLIWRMFSSSFLFFRLSYSRLFAVRAMYFCSCFSRSSLFYITAALTIPGLIFWDNLKEAGEMAELLDSKLLWDSMSTLDCFPEMLRLRSITLLFNFFEDSLFLPELLRSELQSDFIEQVHALWELHDSDSS